MNKIITAEKAAESAEEMNEPTGIIIGTTIEMHRIAKGWISRWL